MKIPMAIASVVCALGLAGCATHQPTQELASAEQAIQSALRAGTEPEASPNVAVAQQKLAEAEDAMDAGRYRKARQLSEEAAVDAQYAQLESEALRAEREMRRAAEHKQLQEEGR